MDGFQWAHEYLKQKLPDEQQQEITWGAEQNADKIQAVAIMIFPRCSFRLKGFSTA